jgi:rod shape-determining protein MreC
MLELLKKYRTPLVAGTLVLVALLIYSANLRHRERTTAFENIILEVTAPLQVFTDSGWELFSGWFSDYFLLVGTKRENQRLLAENQQLKADLNELHEVRLANQRLERLLGFKEEMNLPAVPAKVIAEDASSWFRTVVIDKGKADGVREGLPVVVAEGVVGRILSCAPHQARILLATDASSAVAALVQRNRTRGVARGRGDLLTLEYAVRQAEIEKGDHIITSGMGGVFPKGLPVGQVVRVAPEASGMFQSVEIAPYVDFDRLEEVLVLLKDGT